MLVRDGRSGDSQVYGGRPETGEPLVDIIRYHDTGTQERTWNATTFANTYMRMCMCSVLRASTFRGTRFATINAMLCILTF